MNAKGRVVVDSPSLRVLCPRVLVQGLRHFKDRVDLVEGVDPRVTVGG
jgi:hypothetical protein